MKYRKLRIAWSVAWGVVAVLLCALWVRSYACHDTVIYEERTRTTAAGWNQGELFFTKSQIPDTLQVKFRKSFRFQHEEPDYEHGFEYTCLGFAFKRAPDVCLLLIPFWFATIASVVCAVASQIRWSGRFSLRTLLIATTLVAVGLGVIVYATRG